MITTQIKSETYALKSIAAQNMEAPVLPYLPPAPRHYKPRIGLIGAGGISASHLDAYRKAGWEVAAICNRTLSKAMERAEHFAPSASVTTFYEDILNDASIDVVDITLHPVERGPLIDAALKAGKHVLSQKPFVLDLAEGTRLVRLAQAQGVKLAVNQNGRWAPHLAWMREAVRAGLIGDVLSVHVSVHWNHGWIAGTPFEQNKDLILYDFGIHWFDFISSIVGDRLQSVFATATSARAQIAKVPLLAQALIQFGGGHASANFDGSTLHGPRDTTFIAGTKGSLHSTGIDLGAQTVTLTTQKGQTQPVLEGTWFNDGFRGSMGALLVAIEENSEPANGALENLRSLALAFAAIQSSRTGQQVAFGEATRL